MHTDSVPLTRAPAGNNYLPALGAFAFVLALVGLASGSHVLIGGGLVVMLAVAFTWTLRTWAERATGDDTVNAELYHRFIDPLRTPVVAIVCIGLVVGGLSRVLLAVSKTGSVVVFGARRHAVLRGRRRPGALPQVHQDGHHHPRGLRSPRHPGRRHHRRLRRRARHRAPRRRARAGGARRRARAPLPPSRSSCQAPWAAHDARRPIAADGSPSDHLARLARPSQRGRHFELVPHRRIPAATGSSPVTARTPRGGARPASRGE